ncbi:TIGR03086 family metal-binding protein [Kitasatospora sp. RB6PN24]|uniref:TIGR03086 family metal-binding protein n=1 Tax=Kitasatospora humi TaxID=2893891 RepID=UPI001E59B733|nr:TIGR03086 family metal-binding protein [Kitasatospora humi]MCC9310630.1 TIGR03086 family metal-binding protein [Kitasatospora humi]
MTDEHAAHSPAGMLRLYDEATASFGRRVAQVARNQWTTPTPYHGWSVGRLVGTLTTEQARVPALLAGAGPDTPAEPSVAPEPAATAAADWARATEAARAALAAPGALARTVRTASGERTALAYCAQLITELTVHTWDLAHATCQDPHLAPELVEFALREAGARPPTAGDPQAWLLGLLGRHPAPPASLDPEVTG